MARKRNRPKEKTRQEILFDRVDKLLASEKITPAMVYDILLSGHSVYKQGLGLWHGDVWQAIIDAFNKHGSDYVNPYTAALDENGKLDMNAAIDFSGVER